LDNTLHKKKLGKNPGVGLLEGDDGPLKIDGFAT
jgi:hypothetical protein